LGLAAEMRRVVLPAFDHVHEPDRWKPGSERRSVIVLYQGKTGFVAADLAAEYVLTKCHAERSGTLDFAEMGFYDAPADFVGWWDDALGMDRYESGADFIAVAQQRTKWKEKLKPFGSNGATTGFLGSAPPPAVRLEVEVNTERHLVVEDTLKAIVADQELYRRGDSLGIVVEEQNELIELPSGVELHRGRGCARFLALSEPALGCVLTRNAVFFESRKNRSGKPIVKDVHPPNWLISAVATWGSWPGIRSLLGIASSPWVRPDGSIPDPGFDSASGTLYRPSVKVACLLDHPTQSDAKAASNRFFHLAHDFPFASGFDWVVWLAALLTAIQLALIGGPVPGFVFNGNKAGTGKGLLVDLIGLIVWELGIPTRSYPLDPAEAGKVKLSLALSGIAAVHFDNLPEGGFYGSSDLDSALTSTVVEGRILGQSKESGSVPLRPCWYLTGNNISPGRDAFRRWIPSNLKTDLENPHERSDVEEKDLRRYVEEHRAELLGDALVILRAHALAGRPSCGGAPLGSFEEWDLQVRGAVWFATGNDCLTTQRKAATDSPDRLEKLALLDGWAQLPNGDTTGHTLAEAINEVEGNPTRYATLHGHVQGFQDAQQ